MNQLARWIHTPLAQALGWTLAHFVWEGAALAALLMAVLRAMREAPARRRYAAACLFLAAMPLAFGATLLLMWLRQPAPMPISLPVPAVPAATVGIPPIPAPRFSLSAVLDGLAWLVPVWLAGVLCFYLQALAGWWAVRRLRSRGVCMPPPEWQARLNDLAARLRLSRAVTLVESCFTDTPVLVGYWRPVILLPLGCLTGLSTAQLECILVHELAHVARHDYLVNLLQSLVEGLLFYHPAVWWASRTVRAERENCCDDRVVELIGDARTYAATLAVLEERRAPAPQAALAATGGNLMKRIRRLTTESCGARTSAAPAVSAGVLLVIFAAALAAVPASLPIIRHRHVPGVALKPAAMQETDRYKKWLHEDVAYIITDEERAAFQRLSTDDEREGFIQQFWQRRGAAFEAEHYRRIAYANGHFGWQALAGWKTDRGRIYITYGPPDEIDDHSAGGTAATYPFQDWLYRNIEGVGKNVTVEFVDPDRTGKYYMTMDPSVKQAVAAAQADALRNPYRKWLNEDVAYIITDEERATFRQLATDDERENFIEQFWLRRDPTPGTAENEFKEEMYRRIAYANQNFSESVPGWQTDRGRIYIKYGPPDMISIFGCCVTSWTYKYIEGIGKNVGVTFEYRNGEFRMTKDPAIAREGQPPHNPLAKVLVSKEPLAISVVIPPSGAIGLFDTLDVAYTPALQVAAKSDGCAQLQAKYAPAHPEVQTCLAQLKRLEQQDGQQHVQAVVRADGNIGIDGLGTFHAAGLMAGQLEAAIGGDASVQIAQSQAKSVTVLLPLDGSHDEVHVFGEVTTPAHKIVASFADSVRDESAVAKTLLLKPGSYRLVGVAKNTATQVSKEGSLEFTVE